MSSHCTHIKQTNQCTGGRFFLVYAFSLYAYALLVSVGCGEHVQGKVEELYYTQEVPQTSVIIPEFSIDGIEAMPKELYLSELGFNISEIRFEPLKGVAGEVAFSTIEPEYISFDVAAQESIQHGAPISLPKPGRYLVSLRLEPVHKNTAHGTSRSSFSIQGFVAQSGSESQYASTQKKNQIGPIPLPVTDATTQSREEEDVGDSSGTVNSWTPFSYNSKRAVFFTLNEVEIGPGRQLLSFTFNLELWAFDVVGPISHAVNTIDTIVAEAGLGIDVSRQLESHGHGPAGFVSRGVASTTIR